MGFSIIFSSRPFHLFALDSRQRLEFIYAFSCIDSIRSRPSKEKLEPDYLSQFPPNDNQGWIKIPRGPQILTADNVNEVSIEPPEKKTQEVELEWPEKKLQIEEEKKMEEEVIVERRKKNNVIRG